jgi:hypothetical protein
MTNVWRRSPGCRSRTPREGVAHVVRAADLLSNAFSGSAQPAIVLQRLVERLHVIDARHATATPWSFYTADVLNPADVQPDRVRPLLRTEYDRLVASGAFDDERVELLVGGAFQLVLEDAGETSRRSWDSIESTSAHRPHSFTARIGTLPTLNTVWDSKGMRSCRATCHAAIGV